MAEPRQAGPGAPRGVDPSRWHGVGVGAPVIARCANRARGSRTGLGYKGSLTITPREKPMVTIQVQGLEPLLRQLNGLSTDLPKA